MKIQKTKIVKIIPEDKYKRTNSTRSYSCEMSFERKSVLTFSYETNCVHNTRINKFSVWSARSGACIIGDSSALNERKQKKNLSNE